MEVALKLVIDVADNGAETGLEKYTHIKHTLRISVLYKDSHTQWINSHLDL